MYTIRLLRTKDKSLYGVRGANLSRLSRYYIITRLAVKMGTRNRIKFDEDGFHRFLRSGISQIDFTITIYRRRVLKTRTI